MGTLGSEHEPGSQKSLSEPMQVKGVHRSLCLPTYGSPEVKARKLRLLELSPHLKAQDEGFVFGVFPFSISATFEAN